MINVVCDTASAHARSAVEISFLPDRGYSERMTLADALYISYTSAERDARLFMHTQRISVFFCKTKVQLMYHGMFAVQIKANSGTQAVQHVIA